MNLDIHHDDGVLLSVTRKTALEQGHSEEAVQRAERIAMKKLVSNECRRRIYEVATAETQMNMAAASAIISSKTASSRTDKEKAVLVGLEAAIGWVGAMRSTAAILAADPNKDFTEDEHWPDVPASAADIAGQF